MTLKKFNRHADVPAGRRVWRAIVAVSLVAMGLVFGGGSSAQAQGTVTGDADDTAGVWLYSAGLSGASCSGTAAGAATDDLVTAALASGAIDLTGIAAAEILTYVVGSADETPVNGEVDTTTTEVVLGLSAIDDFGKFSNGDDDAANVDMGRNGQLRIEVSDAAAEVVPDGVVATGVLGTGPDGLDGNELLILEDAELSGFAVTLVGPAASATFAVADYQINPTTVDGADDTVIAIDLDSVPGWVGQVTTILIADDGIDSGSIESCSGQGLLDTSVEVDAVLAKLTPPFVANPDIAVEKRTNGETADVAPGPSIAAGEQVDWTYEVTNTGNVTLTDVTVTDDRETGIECPGGSNTIASMAVAATVTCTLQGIVAEGSYVNVGSVEAVAGAATVGASDVSHYLGTAPTGAIGDRVWLDANNNGLQDPGEQGLAGVEVTLWAASPTGQPVGSPLQQLTTPTDGAYSFGGLEAGDYVVQVGPPAGQVLSPADQGSDDTLDSDIDPITGVSGRIQLGVNVTIDSVDAGVAAAPASIRGLVWNDVDGDGIRASESSLAAVEVNLWSADAGGNPVSQLATTTSSPIAGQYSFVDLPPNVSYVVEVLAPAGFEFSPLDAGGDDGVDSDFDAAGFAIVDDLMAGAEVTLDAGLFMPVIAPTATATATPTPVPTATPTTTPTPPTPTPTPTLTPTATATAMPPTTTPTATPDPVTPTATATPTATPDPVTPTATATATATPTATPDPLTPTATATATATPDPLTPTATATATATATPDPLTPTATATATATATPDPLTPTATATATATPISAGDTADLVGSVWNDLDDDGVKDANEPGAPGAIIVVWEVNAAGGLSAIAGTATSDAEGNYRVLGLRLERSYVLITVLPVGLVVGSQGPDNALVPTTGVSAPFAFTAAIAGAQTTIAVVDAVVGPTATPAASPTATVGVNATATAQSTSTPRPAATITATPVPSPLAITGTSSSALALVASGLVIVGGAIVALGRRRRNS